MDTKQLKFTIYGYFDQYEMTQEQQNTFITAMLKEIRRNH